MCGKNKEKRLESQVEPHRIIIKIYKIICSTLTKISTPAIFFNQHQTFVAPYDPNDRGQNVLQNRYSSKFGEFHWKSPVLESLFDKGLKKDCNLIKRRLQHRCFPVKFVKFLGATIFTEHFWWLLLTRPMPLTLSSRFVKWMWFAKTVF